MIVLDVKLTNSFAWVINNLFMTIYEEKTSVVRLLAKSDTFLLLGKASMGMRWKIGAIEGADLH